MPVTALNCPQCSGILKKPAEPHFACPHCGVLLELTTPQVLVSPEPPRAVVDVEQPPPQRARELGIQVDRTGSELRIDYPRREALGAFVITMSLLMAVAQIAMSHFARVPSHMRPVGTELIAIALLAVAVPLGVWGITLIAIRSRVTVGPEEIRHASEPFPFSTPQTVPVSQIRHLFIKRKRPHDDDGWMNTFSLNAFTTDSRIVPIVTGERSPERLEAIQTLIEHQLAVYRDDDH